MAVLLDLDADGCDPYADQREPAAFASSRFYLNRSVTTIPTSAEAQAERPNPNLNGCSAALGCYPWGFPGQTTSE